MHIYIKYQNIVHAKVPSCSRFNKSGDYLNIKSTRKTHILLLREVASL